MCTREELWLLKSLSMRGSHHPLMLISDIAIMISFLISFSRLIIILMTLRLERHVDDHWYDLSKALASFGKTNSQEVRIHFILKK